MNISKQAIGFPMTEALSDSIELKFGRATSHFDQATSIRVVISAPKKEVMQADVTLRLPGKELHVTASAPDMYKAIDLAADKLSHQVDKHKERIKSHHHAPVKRESAVPSNDDGIQDDGDDDQGLEGIEGLDDLIRPKIAA